MKIGFNNINRIAYPILSINEGEQSNEKNIGMHYYRVY